MDKNDIYEQELQKVRKELQAAKEGKPTSNSSAGKGKNDLLEFFGGLLMLGAGLYMIFQNLDVRSSWGTGLWHIGSHSMPNGLVFLPVFIGIMMLFMMERKVFGWIVIGVGLAIVVAAILMSTSIRFMHTSGYIFFIMFGLTAAGAALVLKQLFKKN